MQGSTRYSNCEFVARNLNTVPIQGKKVKVRYPDVVINAKNVKMLLFYNIYCRINAPGEQSEVFI